MQLPSVETQPIRAEICLLNDGFDVGQGFLGLGFDVFGMQALVTDDTRGA